MIVGADGYRKMIGARSNEMVPLTNQIARVTIPVVGAQRLTRDVILLRSRTVRQQKVITLDYRK